MQNGLSWFAGMIIDSILKNKLMPEWTSVCCANFSPRQEKKTSLGRRKACIFPNLAVQTADGAGTEARKAAVSARKAEDHADRRRPVNQPRGRNRRESVPYESARRHGCSAGIPRHTFSVLQQRRHRCDGAIGPRQPGFCHSAGACGHHEIGNTSPCTTAPAGGFCCPSLTLLPAKPSWRRRIRSIFR